jgi:hypothetical protein
MNTAELIMRLRLQSCHRTFALACVVAALPTGAAASQDEIYFDNFDRSGCALPLTCPVPQAGKACIAGQLTDANTNQGVQASENVEQTCGAGAVGGPCDLTVLAHDFVEYESNPAASTPLASSGVVIDGCGRYRISDLAAPPSGAVAIVVDDAPGSDLRMPAARLQTLAANDQLTDVVTLAAASNTVQLWTLLGGVSDASNGAILLTYKKNRTPTAGISVAHGGVGTVDYFTDPDAQRILVSSAAASTGANGSALIWAAPVQAFSGYDAGTNACTWQTIMTASLPGVLVYAEIGCF